MASYFRSFFSGHPSNGHQANSKTHKRSASTPSAAAVNPNLSYIYAAPGTTPSGASRERPHVHAARPGYSGPSPLRYPTYDASSVRSKQSTHSQMPLPVPPPQLQQKPARTHLYRTTSNKPGDRRTCDFNFYIQRCSTIPASCTISDLLTFYFIHQCPLCLELIDVSRVIDVRTSTSHYASSNVKRCERHSVCLGASSSPNASPNVKCYKCHSICLRASSSSHGPSNFKCNECNTI